MTFLTKHILLSYFRALRIYWILALFCWIGPIISIESQAQIILEPGDFRTIASGDYNNPAIWQTWDGINWIAATVKPEQENNIFIDQNHEVRLTLNESAKDVYLFSAAGPGRKLNLQNFELQVYGALRGLRKEGEVFFLNTVTSALIDWIYPETGRIVFKGTSRTVVDRISWSANTTNSRYTVVFDPNPGEILTVNSAFKANAFIIQSGTVIQTVNTVGIPACSTFSFNNQAMFNGTGPYGDFIIENGGTLISQCSAPLAQIVRRSETIPGALFHVKQGGNLILLGNNPLIDAANFLFEGTVHYSAAMGNQHFIRTVFPSSGNPSTYHHLVFENPSNKILPVNFTVNGNINRSAESNMVNSNTRILISGTENQQVVGWELNVDEVEINKPSGILNMHSDMRIRGNLTMINGQVNFNGFDLYLNTDNLGELLYQGGAWLNLHHLHYHHLPNLLTGLNASFPFGDTYQGGIRKIQMLGASPGGNLSIRKIEIPGANWDPMFDDLDGTPILYQLNSYFEFSSTASSTDGLEMRISAENLIVDQVDDLRIVSNGEAAPGLHLPGLDPTKLWARRSLAFEDLNSTTFTIGSFRELSILPVTWLEMQATWKSGTIQISWTTAQEKSNEVFHIFRSLKGLGEFEKIGSVYSKGDHEGLQTYHFEYFEKLLHPNVYFQLQQIDLDGKSSFSKVFKLQNWQPQSNTHPAVWPNPFVSGRIQVQLPDHWESGQTQLTIYQDNGVATFYDNYSPENLNHAIDKLRPGLIFMEFVHKGERNVIRLIKK